MIINTEKIHELCDNEPPLIVPYVLDENINNPARAQLHLGKLCYCSSTPNKVHDLEKENEIEIAPNSIFLFETYEKVNFPPNLSGRMSLKMGLLQKGLLMPNQTQIDPGYSNVLFGMMYNLSSDSVKLTYKQAITTLEIVETQNSKYTYDGNMKTMTFDKYVQNRVRSSLGDLAYNVEKSNKRLKRASRAWTFFLAILSIVITAISLVVAATALRSDPDVEIMKMQIEELKAKISEQQESLTEYEERLRELEVEVPDEEVEKVIESGLPNSKNDSTGYTE